MRQLSGVPLNSRARILGKISINLVHTTKAKNLILTTASVKKRIRGFKAILCSTTIEQATAERLKIPTVHRIENIEALSEGDIVAVDMLTGEITVLFEKNSLHNSILASTDCNCRCIMCPQALVEDLPENFRNNIKIIRLIDQSIEALGITGGEPTLLGHGFLRLLKECNKRLPKTQIQVLTNGILLSSKDFVDKISRLAMKNLVFCVPLYADTDIEHDLIMQKPGAFEDTIQGLYNLATRKQLVEIRTVIMSLNYRRLPQIAEFIYRNLPFAIHVVFMGMEVEGQARKNIRKLWISPVEYAPYLREAVTFLAQRNMNVSIYNEQLCLMPQEMWSFMCKSISEWKNTYLEICKGCKAKNECAGFFAQPVEEHQRLIKPF